MFVQSSNFHVRYKQNFNPISLQRLLICSIKLLNPLNGHQLNLQHLQHGWRETGDRRHKMGDGRGRQETGDRRHGTGDRRQEMGDRRWDKRLEKGDRRQGTGDRRVL